jgi:hypothetical protein
LPQKFKKSYDHTRKFQLEWAPKLPWVEGVLVLDGILHNVFYKVSSIIDKKPLLLAPKWDALMKHESKKKANEDLLELSVKAREWYNSKTCRHKKTRPCTLPKHLLLCYGK